MTKKAHSQASRVEFNPFLSLFLVRIPTKSYKKTSFSMYESVFLKSILPKSKNQFTKLLCGYGYATPFHSTNDTCTYSLSLSIDPTILTWLDFFYTLFWICKCIPKSYNDKMRMCAKKRCCYATATMTHIPQYIIIINIIIAVVVVILTERTLNTA